MFELEYVIKKIFSKNIFLCRFMTNNHTNFGALAEAHAAQYLQKKGYILLEKNYRYQKAEIDIVVEKNNTLIFVEVKARKNSTFGNPEEFVSKKKQQLLFSAAENYIFDIKWKNNIRYDIIAILNNKNMKILHLEDAFY